MMLTSVSIVSEAVRNSGDWLFSSPLYWKSGMARSPGNTLAKKEKHHLMKVLYNPVVTVHLNKCNNVGKSLFTFMSDKEIENTLISIP